ncbi:MAG: Fmu (Sun) domain-containing protein [Chitinophagaceae bacterium]
MQYKGDSPLAIYLKEFFKKDSKFGSRDRKTISSLCYSYYRAGKSFSEIDLKEKIICAYFLCSTVCNEFITDLGVEWETNVSKPINDKIDFLLSKSMSISLNQIFPCPNHLGEGLIQDEIEFIQSHLYQPDLFIRIRPGKMNQVVEKLKKNGIEYMIENHSLRLPIGTDVAAIFRVDEEVVVQDLSSQKTGSLISKAFSILKARGEKPIVWDCCAASGGKSIMAFDIDNNIQLTVTDIRKSIIGKLIERFNRAGIYKFNHFIQDLTNPLPDISDFNMIIADVPCSGSGTWRRTPEEMFFFDEGTLSEYATKQRAIVQNIVSTMSAGTLFLYITCSVYKDENEEVVAHILENSDCKLIEQQFINGYHLNADSMYTALFMHP